MANSYASRTKVAKDDPETIAEYASDSDTDKVGMILSRGYVLISYGCRSRIDKPGDDGLYKGHSPATVTDTKAVIRYLRNNGELIPAGDLDRIIITGTSGGGALSTLIAASGDSSDFLPFLYENGAAGVEKSGDTYVSTLSDAVFAVIAYCPITDLPNADAAYEWTYADTRLALQDIDFNTKADGKPIVNYTTDAGTVNEDVSSCLRSLYADYVTAYNGGDNTLSATEQQDMADALNEAYTTATTNRNPLTDGYYVIKSAAAAFGDNEYAMYIDDNAKVAWKAYDEDAIGQFVFQLTDQDATVTPDGVTYEVFSYYNVAQKKYIGQCSTQMVYEDASTSDEVWGACAQTLTPEGQFVIQPMWNPTTVSFCLTVDNTSNTIQATPPASSAQAAGMVAIAEATTTEAGSLRELTLRPSPSAQRATAPTSPIRHSLFLRA